ncbi:hypothetical protein LJB89_00170 [Tyzzerella sp. OttesenSCG-928-J15]|nr:hypothetical protein [Tyzzerella sp. OttesenSCG-928-J15]
MSEKNAVIAPLAPVEQAELETYRSQSAIIRKAIGWKRMHELVRPMIEATYADMAVKTAAAAKLGHPEFVLSPISFVKVEGLSWQRFVKGFHPIEKMSVDMDFFMSPDHIIFQQFDEETEEFPAGTAILVEPIGESMTGSLVSALDPVRDKEYCDRVFEDGYDESFGFFSRNMYTREIKYIICTQVKQAGRTGFTARRLSLRRPMATPEGKLQDRATEVVLGRTADTGHPHRDLEYYRSMEYMREKAKADRDAGNCKDEDFEYLNVPFSLVWDDIKIDPNQMDRFELDAHRRFAPLMEKALKQLQE